jgi:hypothetical protein
MILIDEKPTPAPVSATSADNSLDEPPPYAPPPNAALPRVRPVNCLSVARSGDAIRTELVLDPLLVLPSAFLSPLSAGEERDNLRLETKDGTIDAEVWIVPGAMAAFRGTSATLIEQEKVTARLNFKSQRGPMSLRLVCHPPRSICSPLLNLSAA